MNALETLRTALFVPATRPERFAKAFASFADAIIIDLEDSIELNAKQAARKNLVRHALEHPEASFLVRVNGADTEWHETDVDACTSLPNVAGIIVPKAQSANRIEVLAAAGKPVFPLIETAAGVHAVDEIAAATRNGRLMLGTVDLALDLGLVPNTEGAVAMLDHVRYQVLIASKVSGLPAPIDGPYLDFHDTEGLKVRALQARSMGFGGVLCIHPAQIQAVHAAFAPSAEELAWARQVMRELKVQALGVFSLDGKMVDQPIIERARRVIAIAGEP